MASYSEKLRDPRWQRKRLEILSRADFKCERCSDDTVCLHVHHREYRPNADPWDYSNDELQCVCENCHSKEHGITRSGLRTKAAKISWPPGLAEAFAAKKEARRQRNLEVARKLGWR